MSQGNVYLIELSSHAERFFKIGVTVHRYCRFYEIMKSGYQCKIIYMVMGIDYTDALRLEFELKSLFYPYNPLVKFGGYTECFSEVNLSFFKQQFNDIVFTEIVEDLPISWRPDLKPKAQWVRE